MLSSDMIPPKIQHVSCVSALSLENKHRFFFLFNSQEKQIDIIEAHIS